MGFNEAEPLRARTSGRDPAQEVQDSFQTVLDALDAARADLYAMEEEYRRTANPPNRPPSFDDQSEAGGNGGPAHPTPFPSPPPYRRTQGVGPRPELVPVGPQGLLPSVADLPHPGRLHRAPQDAAVEPLWSRGRRPEAVPPPEAARPPATSDGGPTRPEPPAAFPPSATSPDGAHRTTDPPADTPTRPPAKARLRQRTALSPRPPWRHSDPNPFARMSRKEGEDIGASPTGGTPVWPESSDWVP